MALALVKLLLVVMLSRGPVLEAREAEQKIEPKMFGIVNGVLVRSRI